MMEKQTKKNIFSLQGFYLLSFFGFGSITPLISVYLSDVEKLNGTQIGLILSIGPIMMIFFQPIWGMVSDLTKAPPKVLTFTTLLAGIFGFGYIAFHHYSLLLLTAILMAIFQSAIIPISDSISIKYTSKVHYNYGNIRLFGSLGFGIAVFVMGRLSEYTPTIIFYAYFISLSISSFLAFRLPKESASTKVNLLLGVKDLFVLKKFIMFLIVTFLIFGPNLANNFYFGLFVDKLGGSYTGIGVAFLIAVLSEIPFMRISGRLIDKYGLLPIAAIAGAVSMVRWFFYFLEPSLTLVYASAIVQGLSIGLFIPAGIRYIRDITPVHITATAITIYSAIGNGLGNWFSTFFGGIIYDKFSIFGVYFFFGILSLFGVLLNLWLMKDQKDTNHEKSYGK
ncbi:MFS transporter [Neobacillus sp. PS3-40]|uniref:MFS transporter n=1 Tax=Neobacillus sp. PS3-40 TaxID=3070679 RepID=UPI0027DF3435|nr:MFS transporter [Neobacillus sp. PS3-40]WML46384.1 MFS transporter [Neobacillus sp. PS3-40]